jgi:hypothetical protein
MSSALCKSGWIEIGRVASIVRFDKYDVVAFQPPVFHV